MPDYPQIQGQTPDSWNEVYIARALEKFKLEYKYQYAPFGYGLRGSYVVDFVVYNPFPVPVEIYGRYWHTGQLGSDDKLRIGILENYFGRQVVLIWDNESDTQAKAEEAVKKYLL